MHPSLRYLAPLAAFGAAACSSAPPGSGADDHGVTTVSCQDSFETIFVDGQTTGGSQNLVVVGDTLYYQTDPQTLKVFSPGSPTATITAPAPFGPFWVDGQSLLLLTSDGLVRMPVGVGRATSVGGGANVSPLDLEPTDLVKDATSIFGLRTPQLPDGSLAADVQIIQLPLAGGPATMLADVTPAPAGRFGQQLFGMGDTLWLEDTAGEVFSIAKVGGAIQELASDLGPDADFLFAPDGATAMYGAVASTQTLASFGLDGSTQTLWPASAPTFLTYELAVDHDGTLYPAGRAFAAPQEMHAAIAAVRPGAAPTIHCFAEGSDWTLLRLGQSVVYAKLSVGGQWTVVRFPK